MTTTNPAKAAAWFAFALYFNSALLLLATPIFTRLLTSAEYGQVVLYTSWTNVLGIFATLSLSAGVFNNALLDFENDIDGYNASMLGLTALCSALTFLAVILYSVLIRDFTNLGFALLGYMFLFSISNSAFLFWQARERFFLKYKAVVYLGIGTSVTGLALALALMQQFADYRVESRIMAAAVPTLIAGFIIACLTLRKAKAIYNPIYWKYALSMGIPLIPHYAAQAFLQQFDRFAIESALGKSSVGIYGLSIAIASGVTLFWTAINAAWGPWMLRKLKDSNHDAIVNSAKVINIVIATVTLVVALISPEAVRLLSPPAYHEAAVIVPLLVLASYFQFIQSIFLTTQFYRKRSRHITYCSIAASILNVGLNLVLITSYSLQAAAVTIALTYVFQLVIHFLIVLKLDDKVPMSAMSLLLFGSGTTLGIFAALKLGDNPQTRYIAVGLLLTLSVAYAYQNRRHFQSA